MTLEVSNYYFCYLEKKDKQTCIFYRSRNSDMGDRYQKFNKILGKTFPRTFKESFNWLEVTPLHICSSAQQPQANLLSLKRGIYCKTKNSNRPVCRNTLAIQILQRLYNLRPVEGNQTLEKVLLTQRKIQIHRVKSKTEERLKVRRTNVLRTNTPENRRNKQMF